MENIKHKLIKKIEWVVSQPGVIKHPSKILCAVSGGADSMALLHALNSMSFFWGFTLCVGHVEHGIRGESSRADADFVKQSCEDIGIEFLMRSVDVPQLAKEEKLSIEDAARKARYAALFDMAREVNAQRIALAHHKDDQAETVLLHLFRGSGISGICGMRALREDGVLRPMLHASKSEILDYCAVEGVGYRQDESNGDTEYSRNALRHNVMPAVLEIYPGAVNSIARSARVIQQDEDYLIKCANQEYSQCVDQKGLLICDKLATRDAAMANRIVREWLKRMGDQERIEFKHVEAVHKLCINKSGSAIDVPGGRVRNNYGKLTMEKFSDKTEQYAKIGQTKLNIPGITKLETATIVATIMESIPSDLLDHPKHYDYFDYDSFDKEAVVRYRQIGDRFQQLGMQGTQSLKDYFINNKVLRSVRDSLYVCAKENSILWIPTMGVSDSLSVKSNKTKRVLKLEYIAT